jgi:diacylglycerol kinase (ATP)
MGGKSLNHPIEEVKADGRSLRHDLTIPDSVFKIRPFEGVGHPLGVLFATGTDMIQDRKWVFIVNPTAGSGFAASYVPKLREMIARHRIDADLVFTERIGHASELAEAYAARGYSQFIAVGGDGTMNEIARPLVRRKDVTLGIVPAGTGNDFVQILGFPDRFDDGDWKTFFEAHAIPMDAGFCNGRVFLNGMGLGFDAQVASENYEPSGEEKKGGKGKYIWHILRILLTYKSRKMTVSSDHETRTTNCFINTIANGRRFAGAFFLTPGAIANDGLLDVCMIEELSLIERIRILLMVPKGTHLKNRKVRYYRTDRITLEFDEDVPFHLDGELFHSSKFDVHVEPAGINMIYNPFGRHYFAR